MDAKVSALQDNPAVLQTLCYSGFDVHGGNIAP